MTAFCDDCPIRGDCTGYLEDEVTQDLRRKSKAKPLLITQCFDNDGNGSELFYAIEGDVLEKIDGCLGPQDNHIRTGIITNKTKAVQVCGALGVRPNVPDWLEPTFKYELKVLDGTAQIDEALAEIEGRNLRKILYSAGALSIASVASIMVGAFTENNPTIVAGTGGLTVGFGIIIFTVSKYVDSYNN